MSVNDAGAIACDKAVLELDVPVLGICYGVQLLNLFLGGSVRRDEAERLRRRTLE